MSTKPDHKWRIIHIKGTPATTIGYVEAPDERAAIDRAIEKFKIDPRLSTKLTAEKTKTKRQRNRVDG
jgi:hypothetical protein